MDVRHLTKNTLIAMFWTGLLLLCLYLYFENAVVYLFGYRSERFGTSLLNNQVWFISHIIFASASLWLGPLQFWGVIRNRYTRFHRISGRVFVVCSLLAGLAALKLSLVYGTKCPGCSLSLLVLSSAWILFTLLGFAAILRRKFETHKHFMMRSYTCALAFVTIRVMTVLPMAQWFPSIPAGELRVTSEWLCWVVPLLFVEIFLIGLPSIRRQTRAV
jgi:uncharacterized membrane protein